MGDRLITFDKLYQIRVLEDEKYTETKKLNEAATDFLEKTGAFNNILASFMDLVDQKAALIEAEKLKAIGLRNQVESEKDIRKRKQRELQTLIAEKQAELDRIAKEHESLIRLEQEQRILMEKLANNEL